MKDKQIREIDAFIKELPNIQSKVINHVVMLADKHGVDRNKATMAFVNVMCSFAELADLSEYEVEREEK